MSIDALHLVYRNKVASEAAISSFRKYNPDSTYVVVCDGGDNFSEICRNHNCVYIHSQDNIGYPEKVFGYKKSQMMEYLRRFSAAVSLCKSSHILIMEDDVCIINSMNVPLDVEMYVTENCKQNYIHPSLLKFIEDVSGEKIDNHYGLGGGGIFKRETFQMIYPHLISFVDKNFDTIQQVYPTIGWTDCMNSIAFMLAGKKHQFNPQVYELGRWGDDHSNKNYDGIEDMLRENYSILHHYKKHYSFGSSKS